LILTEQHIIRKSNIFWKKIDNLCFLSKNLYNSCLYKIKKHFNETTKILRYNELYKKMYNEKQQDFFNLPAATSQQIIQLADKNIKSYFSLIRLWKRDRTKLQGCPKFPKYKDKLKGRNVVLFTNQQLRFKNGFIQFPKNINIKIKTNINKNSKIKQARFIPKSSCYIIEIIYEIEDKEKKKKGNKASIDLGLNNLVALTISNGSSILINGNKIKSINQYYNKIKSKKQNELNRKNNCRNSNKLKKLAFNRNNKVKDYLHKSSRFIVNYLVKNDVNELIIGYNKQWKQNINMGKINNQAFTNIPFDIFINMIKYKCKKEGIEVKTREESYTSKCSSLDLEKIDKHKIYLGNRIKRGLYKSALGILLNADINASFNIGRKEFGDAFMPANRGLALNPIKINF
jgi:putative transposase